MNGQIEVAVDKPATHSPCRHQRKSLVAVPLKCYNRFLAMFKGTGGATLSQDPESKEYALQRQFPLALLDADSLAAELEKFVDSLERWKGVLADFRPIEEKASAMEPGEVPLSAFGNGGFMSV